MLGYSLLARPQSSQKIVCHQPDWPKNALGKDMVVIRECFIFSQLKESLTLTLIFPSGFLLYITSIME